MKLVDILARELKEWPSDADAITQDDNGALNGNSTDYPPILKSNAWGGGAFYLDCPVKSDNCFVLELADDYQSAIVTRAQWQAAVDAMKAESAPEWVGVGLPPIGIDVEVFAEYSHPSFDRFIGRQVHIVAHDVINGDPVAVFRMPVIDGDPRSDQDYHAMIAGSFRPIRTPEQIAADERQKGIEELGNFLSVNAQVPTPYLWEAAQKIYDAGYRKTSTTDN